MEKEVDVITLCKRLIELTKQEKCVWKDTSENCRYKLNLKNGTIEIYHFTPEPLHFMEHDYYEVSLFDNSQFPYKDESSIGEMYKIFGTLYNEVRELLEKRRRRKIAILFDELGNSEDKK